ncbi:MAG: tRNA 2-thiouridine(34) synthase MnmA [Weeksellaceae bacterium]|nr:tRNA 2-thiouridine(34) synthase MnmA [Weeksellaceae bacterium]
MTLAQGKRVVVGLSGGVDSSVAAALLLEQGYEVIGLFMRNWNDADVTLEDECPWIEDSRDALMVAEKLGIPFQVVDLSADYKTRIVDYMFAEYAAGRTPNPDVLCNREIKFDLFLKIAMDLGADFVATGHYCQRDEVDVEGKTIYRLLAGADQGKDQSYFLCQLNQDQLSKALFPIGHLQKKEVRELALQMDLVTAGKKDSQGLCFIGKVSLPDFLQQQLQPKKGDILDVPANLMEEDVYAWDGKYDYDTLQQAAQTFDYTQISDLKKIGEHIGAHYFTVGQRKGLGIGGRVEPMFVLHTDVEQNVIYAGEGKAHPGLHRKVIKIDAQEEHWLREDLKPSYGEVMHVKARIRYRQMLLEAQIVRYEQAAFLIFPDGVSAATPGQFAAWYVDDELIGSGVISA